MKHRQTLHIVTRRNGGCITLTGDEKGRRTLTLPLGAPEKAAEQFLAGWASGEQWQDAQAISSEDDARELLMACAQRMDLPCPALRFDEDQHRWAHCAWAKQTIYLHRALLTLPEEVLLENLVHELLHFRVHEHSPQFWQTLTELAPAWAYWEGFLRGWAKHMKVRRRSE